MFATRISSNNININLNILNICTNAIASLRFCKSNCVLNYFFADKFKFNKSFINLYFILSILKLKKKKHRFIVFFHNIKNNYFYFVL